MINSTAKLNAYISTLQTAAWVGLDTEADSLHAYPERLCLLQLCTAAGDALIDPLTDVDLTGFFAALSGHRIIMHAADYDLRLLQKHHRFVPSAIFDTMLAARMLGVKQFGLGNLVADFLGIMLEKTSQKANWAIRPLTQRMERYARNDVLHLKALSDRLHADLRTKGRLAWHQEWCARLIKDSTEFDKADPDLVWRVKGSSVLGNHGLAVIRELWKWRESEAIAASKPPFFVLSHEVMVEVAAAAAAGVSFQDKIPRHLSDRRRHRLQRAVEQGVAEPSEQWPRPPVRTSTRPTEAEKRRCYQLERRRDQQAKELNIDPTLIASRSVLWELSRHGEEAAASLMNWQRELLA